MDNFSCNCALLVVTRTGTEEKRHALFGEANTGGTCADLHDARFVVNILCGFRYSGAICADNSTHVGGGQLLGCEGCGARVAAVVFNNQFDGITVDATGRVNISREQFNNVTHVLTFTSPFASERTHQTNAHGASNSSRRNHDAHDRSQSHSLHKTFHT